jgi:hypothetical protein
MHNKNEKLFHNTVHEIVIQTSLKLLSLLEMGIIKRKLGCLHEEF